MKNKIIIIFASLFTVFSGAAQNDNFYYENAVYNENIKTVLMHRVGFNLTNPILELNQGGALVFCVAKGLNVP